MLRVERRTLEKGDVLIDRNGPPEEIGIERSPEEIRGPLEFHCQVSLAGEYILAEGWIKGGLHLLCDRCLKGFDRDFRACLEIQFRHGPAPATEESGVSDGSEVETVYFEGDAVDLAEEVRQLLVLSVPMRSICRDDCRGLCGGCGADLNLEKCRCVEPPPDKRWAALKDWKP